MKFNSGTTMRRLWLAAAWLGLAIASFGRHVLAAGEADVGRQLRLLTERMQAMELRISELEAKVKECSDHNAPGHLLGPRGVRALSDASVGRAARRLAGDAAPARKLALTLLDGLPSADEIAAMGLSLSLRELKMTGDALVVEHANATAAFALSGSENQVAFARLGAQGPPSAQYNHTLVNELSGTWARPFPSGVLVSEQPFVAPNLVALAKATGLILSSLRTMMTHASSLSAYVGEIRAFAGSFDDVPSGWLPADGRCLAVQKAPELFRVVGTSFSGALGCSSSTNHRRYCVDGDAFLVNGSTCDPAVPSSSECSGLSKYDLLTQWAPQRTFCLPDLRSRSIIGGMNALGSSVSCAETQNCTHLHLIEPTTLMPEPSGLVSRKLATDTGAQTVTLSTLHLPSHTHTTSISVNASDTREMAWRYPGGASWDAACLPSSGSCARGLDAGFTLRDLYRQATVNVNPTGAGSAFEIQSPATALVVMIFAGV
jgi:microcystin-dependent protein